VRPRDRPGPDTDHSTTVPDLPSDDEVVGVDEQLETAIEAGDTQALRAALRQAGELDGRRAGVDRVDAESWRNHRIATWWADQHADDDEFAGVYADNAPRPYDELATDSAALTTLASRVQDEWEDRTGKRLRFSET
jgi:hypothetical protein